MLGLNRGHWASPCVDNNCTFGCGDHTIESLDDEIHASRGVLTTEDAGRGGGGGPEKGPRTV